MMRRLNAITGAALYAIVVVVPLFVILLGPQSPERGFWIEFGVALGFIGLAMLSLQSVLTARYPKLSGVIGQDTMLQFHRQAGIVAFGFVLAHPVVLLLAEPDYWEFLDPRVNLLRAAFLILVVFALPILIVTSLWRDRLRLPYEWWRLGHGALAMLILVIGLVHITRVHHYLSDPWKQALWVVIGTASIGSILYARAIKPLKVRRHPYRVTDVRPAAHRTWTIALEPANDTAPLQFRPGQFAFVTLDDSAFALEQHPYSIASSAMRPERLEFVVKELGDYTATIGGTPVGQTAYVDGPYGSLHLPDDPSSSLLMIGGGIGISPILSMLRTLRDKGSRGRVVLIYAADEAEDLVCDSELDDLEHQLGLEVVRVLREPPAGWQGRRGVIDVDLIDDFLPAEGAGKWHVVLCGPPPMMDVVERAARDRGVPLRQIHSERFDIGAAHAVGQRGTQIRLVVLALGAVMLGAAALFAW
ncbi:ferredoxin reductase family protein [Salinilacustrithrix flava]|uniref:ferredoxin reductase family protein n=2 Tax=Salinilacustrithrix flava TaxID=2957203 RepID=UPI003D7C1FB6